MEDDLPDTTVHIKPTLIRNPRHFHQASLFIDSSSSVVCAATRATDANNLAVAAVVC